MTKQRVFSSRSSKMTLLQVLLPTVSSRSLSKGILIKARDWKESQRQGLEDIYDTHGRSLASIRRVKERMDKMMEEIEMTVASAGRNLVRKTFFVAHFNYLCKTDWDFYIPCEAAVTEFNIEAGIIKVDVY